MDEITAVLSSRLRTARKRKNLTETAVAAETNITQSSISNYENGNSLPDLAQFTVLANLYGVSADYLLGLTEFTAPAAEAARNLEGGRSMIDYYKMIAAFPPKYKKHFVEYLEISGAKFS